MSFLAAAFLAGLVALAVPWWLHRINERAPAERDVSSLMLMRETEEPIRTRRTLAHKVLLALRLALLAAVTLAFAQPVLKTATFGSDSAARPAKLVVLDNSFSMRRDDVWQRALAMAEELVASTPNARLVLGGERLVLVEGPAAAEPGWSRLDFAGLSARLDALIAALPEQPRDWEVHLISDFQASGVPDQFNALVEGVAWPFVLHPVRGQEHNWSIDSAHIDNGRMEVLIDGHGEDRRFDVVLRRAGVEAGRVALAPDSGSRGVAVFEIPPSGRDGIAWEVVLDVGDAIAEDNIYRAIQPAQDDTRVAILHAGAAARDGDDPVAATTAASSLTFLTAALDAIGIPDTIRLDLETGWPRSVGAVVAVDPGALPPPLLRRLERHLDDGGGALITVGPRTQRHGAIPISGDVLSGSVVAGVQHAVVVDAGHPVAQTPWRGVEVERSLSLPTRTGETILALAPSDTTRHRAQEEVPLLVEKRIGKGRLLVLLTALDREWSSLVLRPAFVGFVRDAIDYLAQNVPLAAYAGQAVSVPAPSVQIFDSDNRRVLALDNTAGRPLVRLSRPGFYTVRTPGRESSMAVNVDPRESDLRAVPTEFLDRWQAATEPTLATTSEAATDDEPVWHPLAPWLLALTAILLLIESAAANVGRIELRWRSLRGRAAA